MANRTGWLVGTAALAFALFVAIWLGYVLSWGWLTAVDDAASDAAYRHGAPRPGWVSAWNVFCTVLGPSVFRLVGAVVVVVALVRRKFRVALFVLLSVELSGVVTELVKAMIDRPRPATAMVVTLSTSFPSGHAMGVMVSVLALLCVAWPVMRPPLRGWLCVIGAVVVVLIGVGRVVLNVHYPSDVVAGWALGYAYFVVCLLLVPPYRVNATDETLVAPGNAPDSMRRPRRLERGGG